MLCLFIYYFSTTCVKITLSIFSVFITIMAAFNFYMAYQIYQSEMWTITDEEGTSERELAFAFTVAVGAITFFTGIWGLITSKCDKCCCLGTFATLSFIT